LSKYIYLSAVCMALTGCAGTSELMQRTQGVGKVSTVDVVADGLQHVAMQPAWVSPADGGMAQLSLGFDWNPSKPDKVMALVGATVFRGAQAIEEMTIVIDGHSHSLTDLNATYQGDCTAGGKCESGVLFGKSDKFFEMPLDLLRSLQTASSATVRVAGGGKEIIGDFKADSYGNIDAWQSLPEFLAQVDSVHAWVSLPRFAQSNIDGVEINLSPVCNRNGCKGFVLSIENNSASDIEIDWNRTLFISGGQTSGGFMFEGVVYKDRNQTKPSDIVFSKGKLEKRIWPNNLVDFASASWVHTSMPAGMNGAYLTITHNGRSENVKLVVELVKQKVTSG